MGRRKKWREKCSADPGSCKGQEVKKGVVKRSQTQRTEEKKQIQKMERVRDKSKERRKKEEGAV